MNQLQDLIKRVLEERSELRIQQHQLQSAINSRLVEHDHQSPISSFQDGDEIIEAQEQTELSSDLNGQNTMDNSEVSSSSIPEETGTELSEIDKNDELDRNEGTARQILQILEQLSPSEEGTYKGWMSPDVRHREFLPCRYCNGLVLRL